MTIAQTYARALYDLIEAHPQKSATFINNLGGVLKRRGHAKLLPRIFAEYRTLELRRERAARQAKITPAEQRTRALLELYRKLITA